MLLKMPAKIMLKKERQRTMLMMQVLIKIRVIKKVEEKTDTMKKREEKD